MTKHKIVFLVTFLAVFLLAPIYVSTYVGGAELGIESGWKFFGGFMLLYFTFWKLIAHFVSSYPDYFGEIPFLSSIVSLLFFALLCARLVTFFSIRRCQLMTESIFWTTDYLKKLIKHVITATIFSAMVFFLISLVLNSAVMDWFYKNTGIRSSMEIAIPVTLLGSLSVLIFRFFREKVLSTKLQKLIFFIESIIFVIGIINLSFISFGLGLI